MKKATREAYGTALAEIAKYNDRIVSIRESETKIKEKAKKQSTAKKNKQRRFAFVEHKNNGGGCGERET